MDDLCVKPLAIHSKRKSSPHAECLLADYHKHLEQYDSDCYNVATVTSRRTTAPSNCEANQRRLAKSRL